MKKYKLDSIEDAIEDIKNGKVVIVVAMKIVKMAEILLPVEK